MDVVLDSNVIIADYRLRSQIFAALWDYLRKTTSCFLLFKLVYDEVIEKYCREFDEALERWQKMQRRLFLLQHPAPDVEIQVKSLRQKLKNPADGVKVEFIDDYQGVSLDEVLTRGVRKLPPANPSG